MSTVFRADESYWPAFAAAVVQALKPAFKPAFNSTNSTTDRTAFKTAILAPNGATEQAAYEATHRTANCRTYSIGTRKSRKFYSFPNESALWPTYKSAHAPTHSATIEATN